MQQTFQYPRTDRISCNPRSRLADKSRHRAFSILERIESPVTWALEAALDRQEIDFQYPRTDRISCNRLISGSAPSAFTIFQYPRTDRISCNRALKSCWPSPARCFQYPRTDRISCNCRAMTTTGATTPTFSILERIESPVTSLAHFFTWCADVLSVSSNGSNLL